MTAAAGGEQNESFRAHAARAFPFHHHVHRSFELCHVESIRRSLGRIQHTITSPHPRSCSACSFLSSLPFSNVSNHNHALCIWTDGSSNNNNSSSRGNDHDDGTDDPGCLSQRHAIDCSPIYRKRDLPLRCGRRGINIPDQHTGRWQRMS